MRKDAFTIPRLLKEFETDETLKGFSAIFNQERITNKTKFILVCPQNHQHELSVKHFYYSKTRCKTCSRKVQWTEDAILKYIEDEKLNFTVEFPLKIKDNETLFNVTCQHGHKFKLSPVRLTVNKTRCRVCSNCELWTKERILRDFERTKDRGKFQLEIPYDVTGQYTKIRITCQKQHTWETSIKSYFQHKSRCPYCKQSKGENTICYILDKNNINFVRQKTFDTCRYIQKLRFDFYVPEYNLLCEFQGKQHYTPICFGKDKDFVRAEKTFKISKQRDIIKKQWAIDNGYRFLEISYKEIDRIEEILTQELNL